MTYYFLCFHGSPSYRHGDDVYVSMETPPTVTESMFMFPCWKYLHVLVGICKLLFKWHDVSVCLFLKTLFATTHTYRIYLGVYWIGCYDICVEEIQSKLSSDPNN